MKEPKSAKLLLGKNKKYPIEVIHHDTQLVTLSERKNVFNTVSIKDVEFDFTGFSQEEIESFLNSFKRHSIFS